MPKTYTTAEAATFLGILPHNVMWHYRKGNLPGTKPGHDLRFKQKDLEEFKVKRANKPPRLITAHIESLEAGTQFRARSLEEVCPGVHRTQVWRTLRKLAGKGQIRKIARGPQTVWEVEKNE